MNDRPYKPNLSTKSEKKSELPDYVTSIGKDQYKIDLTSPKIQGVGGFPCPKCGTTISPDDESEDIYTILDTKVKDDQLAEVILQCNNCGSKLTLTGFLEYPEKEEKK